MSQKKRPAPGKRDTAARMTRYTTTNGLLAFALYSVGVRMVGIWNCYTKDMLDSMGVPSIRAAREAGKRGKVWFVFERCDQLEPMLKVWDEAQEKVKAGKPMHLKKADAAEFMQMAAHLLLQRADFMELWKKVSARFVESNGEPEITPSADGGKLVVMPGFKMASEGLPKNQARALGL